MSLEIKTTYGKAGKVKTSIPNQIVVKDVSCFLLVLVPLIVGSQGAVQKMGNGIKRENGSYVSFSEMDEFLHSQMDSLGLPGLSIAVINDAETVYHRALGVTNVDTKKR
jgi:hypothetical protein